MARRLATTLLATLWLATIWGCGPQPNLATDLKVVPTVSGYYDDGVQPDKQNRLLPSLTFELHNIGTLPISNIDLVVAFWEVGADGEQDSKQIRGISGEALQPGAKSEPITVRASVGYKYPGPRAEFFVNRDFKGFIVKVFAKRGGKTTRMGEFPVDARLLPAARPGGEAQ
jgi:hypothetical protein